MKKTDLVIENKALCAFVAAAETGSFLQAGQRMNRSKSTISRWIKELEDILGYTLFHTRGNGSVVKINSNGKRLLPKAQSMVNSWQRLEAFSLSLQTRREPEIVRLAFNELIPQEVVSDILLAVKAAYPQMLLHVIHTDLYDTEASLRAKRVDYVLGLHLPVMPCGLQGCVVGDLQTMLIAHPQHWLAQQRNIDAFQLDGETLIYPAFPDENNDHRYPLHASAEAMLVTDYTLSAMLAKKGLGIACVPDHIARPELLAKRVVALDVNNDEFNNLHSLMLFWRESEDDAALRSLIVGSLKEWFGYC